MCFASGGTPAIPPMPPAPPLPPRSQDAAVVAAGASQRSRSATAQGSNSTILTAGKSLTAGALDKMKTLLGR